MHLTNTELDSLRKSLETKRAELLRLHARNVEALTHSPEGTYADEMESAARAEDEGELLGLADQEQALLEEVNHALTKFDLGSYGLSEVTQEPIPIERLRVIPWARRAADE